MTNNSAANDSRVITDTLKSIGGKELCSRSDAGKGLDNTQPWVDAFYSVPDSPTISSQIISELNQKKGIELSTTKEFVKKYGSEGHDIQIKPLDYENKPGIEFLINQSKEGLV